MSRQNILQIVSSCGSLFRSAANFWGGMIEILIEQGRCFRVIHMQGMIIVASKGRLLISNGTANTKQLEETCNPNQQVVAIFLHPERLPLDDGCHCTLNARLFAHDAMDLFWFTKSQRRKQHHMCGNRQDRKRDQHRPASLAPFSNKLTDKYHKRKRRGK